MRLYDVQTLAPMRHRYSRIPGLLYLLLLLLSDLSPTECAVGIRSNSIWGKKRGEHQDPTVHVMLTYQPEYHHSIVGSGSNTATNLSKGSRFRSWLGRLPGWRNFQKSRTSKADYDQEHPFVEQDELNTSETDEGKVITRPKRTADDASGNSDDEIDSPDDDAQFTTTGGNDDDDSDGDGGDNDLNDRNAGGDGPVVETTTDPTEEYEFGSYSVKEEAANSEIKRAWRSMIRQPLSAEEIAQYTNQTTKEAATTLYPYALRSFVAPDQFPIGKEWIDKEVVHQLKGSARLCHEPQIIQQISQLPKSTRGVRLVTSRATHSMQLAIVKALADSIDSALVVVNEKILQSVRQSAMMNGIPRALLTKHAMFASLLDLIEEEQRPFIVAMGDKGAGILNSPSACEVILDEMQNPSSRVFFIFTSLRENVTEAGVQIASINAVPATPSKLPPDMNNRTFVLPSHFSFKGLIPMLQHMKDAAAKARQDQSLSEDNGAGPKLDDDLENQKEGMPPIHMMDHHIFMTLPGAQGSNRFPFPLTISIPPVVDGTKMKPPNEPQQRAPTMVIPPQVRAMCEQFEDVVINPPRDHELRVRWDRMMEEEIAKLVSDHNLQLLAKALRENSMICTDLATLKPLISRNVLSREQIKNSLLAALKIEAAKNTAMLSNISDGMVPISSASLEMALLHVCKGLVSPAVGKPFSRTKEDVSAMIQDKQERGLLANIISPQDIGVSYEMIGGLDDVKELLRQSITYPLKYPHLYREGIASEAVKGVLLFGPPGTGKTMLAKAVATEGGATFLSVDASTIESKWLGESEKNARAVFTLARKLAPCVIFLDEVDSVLSSRERGDDSSHGTLTSVKTTLMQEWDGLRTTSERVVVIASTNRPYDLDEAVLRRLPRRIMVDLPDRNTRKAVLEVSMAGNRIAADVNYTAIADQLEGYTGSDIKEICREAVVRIAHEQALKYEKGDAEIDSSVTLRSVTAADFDKAIKKLRASVNEKGREMSRLWEWNEKFGEIKKKPKTSQISMYL